jgi:hypothetical protein
MELGIDLFVPEQKKDNSSKSTKVASAMDDTFYGQISELKEFLDQSNGTFEALMESSSNNNKSLSQFLARQKCQYRRGRLPFDKAAVFVDMKCPGFDIPFIDRPYIPPTPSERAIAEDAPQKPPSIKKTWIQRFQHLKDFKVKTGHCRPTLSTKSSVEENQLAALACKSAVILSS